MSVQTIFEKILNKQIPADILFEDEDVMAFRDIEPKAPVHVLVIPKVKVENFSQLRMQNADLVGVFIKKISVVAHSLGLEKNGYRVVFNCGEDGGQTVNYIHAHILGGKKLEF